MALFGLKLIVESDGWEVSGGGPFVVCWKLPLTDPPK